jgi:hypothetical protein
MSELRSVGRAGASDTGKAVDNSEDESTFHKLKNATIDAVPGAAMGLGTQELTSKSSSSGSSGAGGSNDASTGPGSNSELAAAEQATSQKVLADSTSMQSNSGYSSSL